MDQRAQKSQIAVLRAVITPMLNMYQPPMHLKNKTETELLDAAISHYGKALAGFNEPVLASAWDAVTAKHKTWTWPALGEISDACRVILAAETPAPTGQRPKQQWDIRNDETIRLREAFMAEFSESMIAKEAQQDGWYHGINALRDYAFCHAHLQAQAIAGAVNYGWDAWAWGLGTWHERTFDARGEVGEEFFQAKNRKQIQVSVPQIVIAWMKEKAISTKNKG